MAVVRIDLVRKELEVVCKASQQIKHLVKQALQKVQADPAAYPVLEELPEDLSAQEGAVVRKIRIVNASQSVRLLYLHRKREDGEEQADLLYAFFRKDGYNIDWEWIRSLLGDE